ncbi:hypothetical protein CYMTET_10977, partial [Cymbomonas tetramitiformis]
NVYVLAASDGEVLWAYHLGDQVKCSPAVDPWEGLVWCGSHGHRIAALRATPSPGRPCACLWELPTSGSVFGSPAFDYPRRRVYVATLAGALLAIDLAMQRDHGGETSPGALDMQSGGAGMQAPTVAWERRVSAPAFSGPQVDPGGKVLLGCVDGWLHCFGAEGTLRWRTLLGGPVFAPLCIPWRGGRGPGDSIALVAARDHTLYAVCTDDGSVMWKWAADAPLVAAPCVELVGRDDDCQWRICVCSSDGAATVLSVPRDTSAAPRGSASVGSHRGPQVLGRTHLGGDIFSSPVLIGGRLFVGSRDDHLYCLRLRPAGDA